MNRPFPATARQLEVLRFIVGFVEANEGVGPSIADLRQGLGIGTSSGAITRLLASLQERGHIRRRFNRARAIEVLSPVSVPRAPDGAPLYFVPVGRS